MDLMPPETGATGAAAVVRDPAPSGGGPPSPTLEQLLRPVARLVKPPPFPAWPLEPGVDRLLRFTAGCQLRAAGVDQAPFLWFWPGDARAAAILTHDVESAEGLRLSLDLADLEQEREL